MKSVTFLDATTIYMYSIISVLLFHINIFYSYDTVTVSEPPLSLVIFEFWICQHVDTNADSSSS